MALYQNPVDAIYAAIAAQNPGVVLNRSEYVIGVPAPYVDPEGDLNTEVEITPASVDSPYQGAVTVRYTRLDLASLDVHLPQPVRANGIATIADVITVLNRVYGLNFTTDDLVQGNVTTLTDDAGVIELEAETDSLGWFGSVELTFAKGGYDVATEITTKRLPGLMYPAQTETKAYAQMYSYWRDFSDRASDLYALATGTADVEYLPSILNEITGDAWEWEIAAQYSLLDAEIIYNGTASGQDQANGDYNWVLTVELGPDCQGLSGTLFLHYNYVPF